MEYYQNNHIYPISVISTMSSGKSTFINALLGKPILPSRNEACTSHLTTIYKNNSMDTVTCYIEDNNNYDVIQDCSLKQIEQYITNKESVVIECGFPGVSCDHIPMMIIDTPGTNNSMDTSHYTITIEHISSLETGTVFFILDATSLTSDDFCDILKVLHSQKELHPDLNIIFIINKMDVIDPEIEPYDTLLTICHQFLRDNKFENPITYPVSARAALLFRQELTHQPLTKSERIILSRYFDKYYMQYQSQNTKYQTPPLVQMQYSNEELEQALYNTGFHLVENEIEFQLRNFSKTQYQGG